MIKTDFLIVIVILILLTGCSNNGHDEELAKKNEKGESPIKFSPSELELANEALSKGVRIEDPENDFYKFPKGSIQGDGRPDNTNPYPLNFTDLKSFSIGADENYIYIKYEFYGKFPNKIVRYNEDLIISTNAKLEEIEFTNSNGVQDSASLINDVTYVYYDGKQFGADYNPVISPCGGQMALISPDGEDETREPIYKTMSGKGLIYGGPGYDYIIGAYPLDLFGIKYGDEITFSMSTETGSSIYHHEAVDFLLGKSGEKGGDRIRYKLGSDTYERIDSNIIKNK